MNTLSMARRKKELTPNQKLAQAIVDQYQPKSVEDMQDALKDIFGPMFEAMLKGEMNRLGSCCVVYLYRMDKLLKQDNFYLREV